jgi:hypothetical protein
LLYCVLEPEEMCRNLHVLTSHPRSATS